MPAFMQSSKLHLSVFRSEVSWRFGLEEAEAGNLFFREVANFFCPVEYRLVVTMRSNGQQTVFSPIVVGRTYQTPGRVLREEEDELGAGCAGTISWRLQLVLANLKREDLPEVVSRHFPERPGGVYFQHPHWPRLALVRSQGTLLRVCGAPATAHRDFNKALQDTWCKRP